MKKFEIIYKDFDFPDKQLSVKLEAKDSFEARKIFFKVVNDMLGSTVGYPIAEIKEISL